MFENFPYTDMHQLNLDWIIKIAKDFLDQYTHIQQLIADGEQSLQDLTADGLQQLQEKADNLESLLQQWYDTHSQDIANELARAVAEFASQASTIAQNVVATIPSDYTDLSTRVGNISVFAEIQNLSYQKGYWRSQDGTIGNTATDSPFCCTVNPLDTSTKRVVDVYITSPDIATVFVSLYNGSTFLRNEDLLPHGSAHYHYIVPSDANRLQISYIGLNGMTPEYVSRYTITTLNEFSDELLNHSLYATFVTTSNPVRYIEYNISAHTIKFPTDSIVYYGNGKQFGVPNLTIDISSQLQTYTAVLIWALDNNTLTTSGFNQPIPTANNPHLLGYVYGNNVWINGVSPDHIILIDGSVSYSLSNKHHDGTFVTIHSGVYPAEYGQTSGSIVYDRTNKSLYISGDAFFIYRGSNVGNRPVTVDLSDIPGTETFAWKLYMRPNGTVYAIAWNGNPADNADDCIGYGYNDAIWIEGVPQYAIEQVDLYNKVYCFGDSIVAGFGASENFHQLWHRWYRNIHCYNWGVGGTGWQKTETNGTTMGGSERNYAAGLVVPAPANNTVLGMMQYVQDDIDHAVILSGTNDYGSSVTAANFRTAVQNTLDYALTRTGYILVITPIRRTNGETPNSAGMKLSDYSAIIKEECASRSIPCVDGYDIAINPNNNTQKTRFIPDGLHPNSSGHNRIAHHAMSKFYEAITLWKILK